MSSTAVALPQYKRKKRPPVPESRAWKVMWALPAITALLLLAHLGRVVERAYLPLAVLLGLYLCLKFPRVYLAYAVLVITISPLANRIAASQSMLLTQSPLLAAPFLVVAMGALRMWRARPPGTLSLVFTLPMLAVFYAAGVTVAAGHVRLMVIPLAGWLSPIFFGLYCYVNEDEHGSLTKMYVRAMVWAGAFIAVYGLIQYQSPFQWDLDWLSNLQSRGMAISMGSPEPHGIRLFSSLSSPASAAVFLGTGILLMSQLRSRWRYPAMLSGLLTLAFTSVRAAWLAFAIAGVLMLVRASNAARVQVVAGGVVLVMAALAAGQTEAGAGVVDRFSTFGNLKQDHSMQARQHDMQLAAAMIRDKPFGGGLGFLGTSPEVRFSPVDVGALSIPIDLGYLGTLLYLLGILISLAKLQFPAFWSKGDQFGLAVVSLLPIFLLFDEDLLASYSGILFFAPTALLLASRVRRERGFVDVPAVRTKRSKDAVVRETGSPVPKLG